VKWELECVLNAEIPILGLYTEAADSGLVPEELRDVRVVEWSWTEIVNFVQSLQEPSRRGASQ
jgi:hypothetical protein